MWSSAIFGLLTLQSPGESAGDGQRFGSRDTVIPMIRSIQLRKALFGPEVALPGGRERSLLWLGMMGVMVQPAGQAKVAIADPSQRAACKISSFANERGGRGGKGPHEQRTSLRVNSSTGVRAKYVCPWLTQLELRVATCNLAPCARPTLLQSGSEWAAAQVLGVPGLRGLSVPHGRGRMLCRDSHKGRGQDPLLM